MENVFVKCERHSHGMEVKVDRDEKNPNNIEFTFSIWQYGKNKKPSFKQRWDYFWTGKNDIIKDYVILDLKKTTEISKHLTSNIDKVNLDIKKYNSSETIIKDLIKKSEENMEKILKKKPKKSNQPTKQEVEKEIKEIKKIITKTEKINIPNDGKIEKIGELNIPNNNDKPQGGETNDGFKG